VEQTHPFSLQQHLSNGRPWSLDRTAGGLRLLHPAMGTGKRDGMADRLRPTRSGATGREIRDFDPAALVVLSADAVYALDYEDVVRQHLDAGLAVTMVTTKVDLEDAGRYGVVQSRTGA
jgi:glucose-1-phosphate adenylyltransferase